MKVKKFLAFVLTVCLLVSLVPAAFAADPFVGGHESHHAVHYFAFVNLKGVLISLGIGVAVYLLVIRRLLTKQQGDRRIHYNPLEGRFSLEENIYKPLFRGVVLVLTVVCRLFNDLTDLLVLAANKTVFRPAKDLHEPHERRYAYALGRLYGRATKQDANRLGEVFVRAAETIAKTTRRLSGNFSFALLMTCFGICVILLIILFAGAR